MVLIVIWSALALKSGDLRIFRDFFTESLAYSVACVQIREKVSPCMRADGNKYHKEV